MADGKPWTEKSTSQLTAEEKLEAFRATGATVIQKTQPGHVGRGPQRPVKR